MPQSNSSDLNTKAQKEKDGSGFILGLYQRFQNENVEGDLDLTFLLPKNVKRFRTENTEVI